MKKLILITGLLFCMQVLSAQIEGDPDTGTSIPVDGGIVTITLMAAAYGVKRYKENKDQSL